MMRMRLGTSLPANVPTLLEEEKERNNRVVYRDIIRDCVHSVDIRGSGLISGRIAGARPPQTFYFRMIITLRKFDIRFSNIFSKWDEQEMKSNEARVLKRLKRLFKLIRLSNLNFGPRFSCVSSSLASFLSRNNDSQLNEKGGEKQQTLSLFLSLPPSKRINFDPHPRSKYSRKGIWNRSTKEWLENLSSRAESAPWLTRIETSNQSPLISPISRIAWLPEQECTNGWDATNAKSSFSSLHLSSPSSSFFLELPFESATIFIGGNRIFLQTPPTRESSNYDFNGCQPTIRPQIPLEMLIPIIRPTIVSGTGLNGVEGTPIPLIYYINRRNFRTKMEGEIIRAEEDALSLLSSIEDRLFSIECYSGYICGDPSVGFTISFIPFWLICQTFERYF